MHNVSQWPNLTVAVFRLCLLYSHLLPSYSHEEGSRVFISVRNVLNTVMSYTVVAFFLNYRYGLRLVALPVSKTCYLCERPCMSDCATVDYCSQSSAQHTQASSTLHSVY